MSNLPTLNFVLFCTSFVLTLPLIQGVINVPICVLFVFQHIGIGRFNLSVKNCKLICHSFGQHGIYYIYFPQPCTQFALYREKLSLKRQKYYNILGAVISSFL